MLKIDVHKHVAFVLLDRPDVHNSFNDELVKRLTEAFTELGQRDDVRLIVLAGNGKSFCSGADLNWMKRMVEYTHEENLADARAVGYMYLALPSARSRSSPASRRGIGRRRWPGRRTTSGSQ
jgi:methylglutaconyl-CoA hydratase